MIFKLTYTSYLHYTAAMHTSLFPLSKSLFAVTGTHYELSPFNSIPASFWWVLVTATTVGYGDMYPTSFEGKMIATLTMMVGVLALALPVSVIGANFADIYGKKQKQTLVNDYNELNKEYAREKNE